MITARVLADSVSPAGHRLTTMEVTMPRFLAAEFNTHRQLSRNAASSRAIPVERMIEMVRENPYIPQTWTSNQPGMVGGAPLTDGPANVATSDWMFACRSAIRYAEQLSRTGVHKQHVNRLLEPFMWHTVIVSATDWGNFFALRCAPDAQPEFQDLAMLMNHELATSIPVPRGYDDWHLPYITDAERDQYDGGILRLQQISVARCARVSYNRHGSQSDVLKDAALYDRLASSGHWSPFEHVARPKRNSFEFTANFSGWVQLRAMLDYE